MEFRRAKHFGPRSSQCGRTLKLPSALKLRVWWSRPECPFFVSYDDSLERWGALEALAAREVHPMANSDGLLQHNSERELISTVQ